MQCSAFTVLSPPFTTVLLQASNHPLATAIVSHAEEQVHVPAKQLVKGTVLEQESPPFLEVLLSCRCVWQHVGHLRVPCCVTCVCRIVFHPEGTTNEMINLV